jgi:glycosyltransferase involved in cell wall biosynthesis
LRLFTVSVTGLYPFDENGPAIALYAMLKGMLEDHRSGSEEITTELLIGVSNPKYLDVGIHPLLKIPMNSFLPDIKSAKGFATTVNSCSRFINKIKDSDIVFYNSPPADAITITYPITARLRGKKQVYYLHGSLVNERVDSTTRKYFHLITRLGFLDRVIIPLESFKDFVSKKICPYEIIATIPECVVTPWYEDSHQIPLEGDPVVLYAGRLVLVKGVDVLLKAFATLTSHHPSAKLYLAGSGPLELPLKKLCKDLMVSRNVVFLGHVSHNKLKSLYRSCEVFVIPSDAEFMSISLLEAMASRRAVIASDIAAMEVIENGRNGLAFPRRDFKALAHHLLTLADDRAFRKKLSDEAYVTVKKKFDYQVVASRLIEEMHNILK